MATLVLTVVGGIVGGPVGAAIGAYAGQQIDAELFKPKGREGPRLADLKVQASTYGQQIPKLFGTMRVAGSVIWATDLIERRTKRGGGKGRPSTTEFSYGVSLAIALSSRPIRAVRRIWADGNLLRGASGSFSERCTFRWYDGSEDQLVDPLVAAAVGMASACAFRGLAYAVLEELELASFGNRIPSLTFEIEADTGSVDTGLIGDGLLGESGRCVGRWPFGGYAASGDRLRDALEPLFDADGVRLVSGPEGWQLAPPGGDVVELAGFAEARRSFGASDRIEQRRAPLSSLPGTIRLRHYEPERDYQLGQQAARVAGGGVREDRVDLPALLSAGSARALTQTLAAAAVDGREVAVWATDLAALALTVGSIVELADGSRWRLASRTVRDAALSIELRRFQPVTAGLVGADAGLPVTAPDWPDAEAMVALFDVPGLDAVAATAPRLLVAAAGSNDGWRGADLWIRPAPEAEPVAIGFARPALALGTLATPIAAGSSDLFDMANAAIVELINPSMLLESRDDSAILGGANRAMIGSEMIQFGVAELLAPGRWRLSRLLRGRGGTDVAAHIGGAPFAMIEDAAIVPVPDMLARLAEGGGADLQWASRRDTDVQDVAIGVVGRALQPLAPVHGLLRADGAGGIVAEWVRRTRADTGWRDGVDVPLGESREAWRIELVPPVSAIGSWETTTVNLPITAPVLAALAPGHSLAIRQIGDFALSPPLLLPLP
jgi:hypothetical protein